MSAQVIHRPQFFFVRATFRPSFWAFGSTRYNRRIDHNGIGLRGAMLAVYIGPLRLLFMDWSKRWEGPQARQFGGAA